MTFKLEKREAWLLAAVLGLLAVALWGPQLAQSAHHHDFADRRGWAHLPFAMDVLSNLPFALWGALGLGAVGVWVKRGLTSVSTRLDIQHGLAAVFFAGLLLTAAASSWYHLRPDDAGLAIDRLGMVVAFAGLLGLAVFGRVSHRAGLALAFAVLALGPVSVGVWSASGNVLPWAVLQFGGMALVLVLASLPPLAASSGALAVRWGAVILIYALAKLLELADHEVYAWTSQLVSGHSLKHGVASCVAWPVLAALKNQGRIPFSSPALPRLAEPEAQARQTTKTIEMRSHA